MSIQEQIRKAKWELDVCVTFELITNQRNSTRIQELRDFIRILEAKAKNPNATNIANITKVW